MEWVVKPTNGGQTGVPRFDVEPDSVQTGRAIIRSPTKKHPIERRSTRRTINVTAVRKIRAWQIKCRHLVETLASKKIRECIGHDVPHNSLARIRAARNANTRSGGPGYCGIGISRSVNIECHNGASNYLWVLCVDEVGQFLN